MPFLSERVQLPAHRTDAQTNITELIYRIYKEITPKAKVKIEYICTKTIQ